MHAPHRHPVQDQKRILELAAKGCTHAQISERMGHKTDYVKWVLAGKPQFLRARSARPSV